MAFGNTATRGYLDWTSAGTLKIYEGTVGSGAERMAVDGTGLSFFGSAPVAKQNITGSRGGNVALADLLTKLALTGLITDSTT